jgi:hypothetical protein
VSSVGAHGSLQIGAGRTVSLLYVIIST